MDIFTTPLEASQFDYNTYLVDVGHTGLSNEACVLINEVYSLPPPIPHLPLDITSIFFQPAPRPLGTTINVNLIHIS
jgi:hypothetical protein